MNKNTTAALWLTLALPCWVLDVDAASLGSYVTVTGQNGSSVFHFQPMEVVTDTSLNAVNASFNITGTMNNGIQGTMTYAVDATARSDYGSLHVSYETAVTNAFFSFSNAPYDPSTGTGAPTWLSGQSNASFKDDLFVTGGTGLSQIRLLVDMDGSLGQSGGSYPYAAGYAALWQNYPAGYSSTIRGSSIRTDAGGTYDQTILTDPFPLIDGTARVELLLQAYSSWGLQYLSQGENVTSTIDFSHTARVVGVQGFDNEGNSVTISSVIGQSGTSYPLSSVPLPAAIWLLGSGLLSLIGVARRKAA